MSKGVGRTQQRILTALADAESPTVTVAELVERIGCSDRQIRRAVHSLESRGLVVVRRKHLGWNGSEHGRLMQRKPRDKAPTALTVKQGERWPLPRARPWDVDPETWTAWHDAEFVRVGMPTHGLKVSAPHRLILAYKARCEHFDRALRDDERAELRALVGGCQLSDEDRAELDRLCPIPARA